MISTACASGYVCCPHNMHTHMPLTDFSHINRLRRITTYSITSWPTDSLDLLTRFKAAPHTSLPVCAAPHTSLPVCAAPHTSLPVCAAPHTSMPVCAAPHTSLPVCAAPHTSLPMCAAPHASIPHRLCVLRPMPPNLTACVCCAAAADCERDQHPADHAVHHVPYRGTQHDEGPRGEAQVSGKAGLGRAGK